MKRLLRDTAFTRLVLLVLGLMACSHIVTFVLINMVGEPPAHRSPAGDHEPGFPLWLVLGVLGQFVAAAVAVRFGSAFIVKPLRDIAQASERLGADINSPAMRETGMHEARRAARVFNQMHAKIRTNMQDRNRFLAAMSHDLRTPLTRMTLRLDQLEASDVKLRLAADVAEMSSMLEATLAFLLDSGSQEEPRQLDLQSLLESIADDAQELGQAVSLQGQCQPILAQSLAIRRCLSNLIDNALRYGGSCRITLADAPQQVQIEVQDDGPGIPEAHLSDVLTPFVRLEASRSRHTGGVGLGLSIVQATVLRHGGTLMLENAAAGGLTVRLQLPRRSFVSTPTQS